MIDKMKYNITGNIIKNYNRIFNIIMCFLCLLLVGIMLGGLIFWMIDKMINKTEQQIIEFIKRWKCGSADRNSTLDEWEQDDIRCFFKINKKWFKDE